MSALHGASDSGGTPPAVPSLAILLVDDEPAMVKALTALLRRDGHSVDTAANGQLALVQLQERLYDLILSDLRMPELDGPGLYRALEQHASPLCGGSLSSRGIISAPRPRPSWRRAACS